jgi:head-tail adaptor
MTDDEMDGGPDWRLILPEHATIDDLERAIAAETERCVRAVRAQIAGDADFSAADRIKFMVRARAVILEVVTDTLTAMFARLETDALHDDPPAGLLH